MAGGRVEAITSPHDFLGYGRVRYLGVMAEPTSVQWVGPPRSGPKLEPRLSYLGERGNTFVFYDPARHDVTRLPVSDVTIADTGGARLCRPG